MKSFDVSLVRAEISEALCLSSTARATVTENKEISKVVTRVLYGGRVGVKTTQIKTSLI